MVEERLPSRISPRDLGLRGLPRMVDDEGKDIVLPEALQTITQLAQLGQLTQIRKSLQREHFLGKALPLNLDATGTRKHYSLLGNSPHVALFTAYFYNRGPDTVYLSINDPFYYHTLQIKEDWDADFSKGDERINLIYYYCAEGETASVEVSGKY